jgi:hypothetical protein
VAPQEYLRSNKIYVGLFLIRQSLSGGVRLLCNLPLLNGRCQGNRRDGRIAARKPLPQEKEDGSDGGRLKAFWQLSVVSCEESIKQGARSQNQEFRINGVRHN